MVGTGLLAAACSHSYRPNVGRDSEGVTQALGDPVNGDLDGKAIHCSRLVKGPFRPTNSWSISFWASLSFCALSPLRGREGSFARTQKIDKLGRRHKDEVQPRLCQ